LVLAKDKVSLTQCIKLLTVMALLSLILNASLLRYDTIRYDTIRYTYCL